MSATLLIINNKVPYVGEKSTQIERNIKKMTEKVYFSEKPRVITSSSVLSPKWKDLISDKENSCVVHNLECCCSNSSIGQLYKSDF